MPIKQTSKLLNIVFIFIVLVMLLTLLSMQFGKQYVKIMIPVYITGIEMFSPFYKVKELSVKIHEGKQQISLLAQTQNNRVIKNVEIKNNILYGSKTSLWYALQHVILLLSIVFAWVITKKSNYVKAAVGCMLALLIVEVIDIPLILLGSIENLVLTKIDLALPGKSALLFGYHFMAGGGRSLLVIVLSMFIIILLEKTTAKTKEPLINSSFRA